jgi:hypothetical protein
MRLSEDRISHISQAEERILREIKHTITDELKFEDEADEAARRTIQSLSRRVPEGSREWDVLYRKYVEEEMNRRKKI